MKKFTGNFTTSAGKALKTSDRLICRTTDEGEIYVTNGFVAYKMIPPEYAAIVPARRLLRGRQLELPER